MRRLLYSALLTLGLYGLTPVAMLVMSAKPASAECYYGCGWGWGWGLVNAIAYDDYYDGDPWYDDGQFGAGEVALTLGAIALIARANDNYYYDQGYGYDQGYAQPGTVYRDTVYQGTVQQGMIYHDTGSKAFIAAPAATVATQPVTAAVQSQPRSVPAERYIGQEQLANCARYIIDHREYRYCGGVWYARQFLMNWGPVATPPGVVMQ